MNAKDYSQGGTSSQTASVASPVRPTVRRIPLQTYRVGLGVMLIVCIVVVGSLLIQARQKLADLESSSQDNVQWSLSQFEVEYLALVIAAQTAQSNSTTQPAPDYGDLRLRYDILYSRLQTLEQSTLYLRAFAQSDTSSLYETISKSIYDLVPVIDAPDPDLTRQLDHMATTLSDLREPIRKLMTDGTLALAYQTTASRREISTVMFRLAVATAFLLVVLAAFVVLFRRMALVSDIRLRENLTTSARLEAIFSTSRDGIAVIEADGRIVNLNRAGAELFGRNDVNMRGARIGKLLCYQDGTAMTPLTGSALLTMAHEGRKTGIRLTGLRPNGSQFPVEISIDISTRERRPICVCVIRDISHQMKIEAELVASRDTARAGERAKARFLGMISHEMRTPLNGIIGTLDLMTDHGEQIAEGSKDSTQNYLAIIRRSAETLRHLVDDVLDITQIESGVTISKRTFDLDALIADQIQTHQNIAQAKAVEINNCTPAALGWVTGDPDRIRQVLDNLIGNAVKFTETGTVTVEATRLPNQIIEIQIADTGLGMDERELDRVFDDFVRTDQAIELQIQGTGLGLGIARALVEAMGGSIGAESEPGEGSLFWIRLPLATAEALNTPTQKPNDTAKGRPARILLVEDNATNRFIARRLLENEGHSVTEVENGQAAVAAADSDIFDIIFMDISMPVMDGLTAARTIRNGTGPNKDTRIVALTAHISAGLDMGSTEQVMQAVINKPLDRNALRKEIALAIGTTPPTNGSSQSATTSPATLLAQFPAESASRLIKGFLSEIDAGLREIPVIITSKPDDPCLVARLHDMAGACASFALPDLHQIFSDAETALRQARPELAQELVRQATGEWTKTREGIQALCPTQRENLTTDQA
jgi:PAS domain S-box-containing protein